jgi:hypothetical protein
LTERIKVKKNSNEVEEQPIYTCDDHDLNPVDPEFYYEWAPVFVASLAPRTPTASYNGRCFGKQEWSFDITSKTSFTVTVDLRDMQSFGCTEYFVMGNTEEFHLEHFTKPGTHSITFNMPSEDEEIDVNYNGIKIYQTCHNIKEEFASLMRTMALMGVSTEAHPKLPIPSIDEEEAVMEFLAESMDITFERREVNFVDIPAELVHSGDFFGY